MTWRSLFDVVICSARKPAFFAETMPLYEIVGACSWAQSGWGVAAMGQLWVWACACSLRRLSPAMHASLPWTHAVTTAAPRFARARE
jgi:hypothetical protein